MPPSPANAPISCVRNRGYARASANSSSIVSRRIGTVGSASCRSARTVTRDAASIEGCPGQNRQRPARALLRRREDLRGGAWLGSLPARVGDDADNLQPRPLDRALLMRCPSGDSSGNAARARLSLMMATRRPLRRIGFVEVTPARIGNLQGLEIARRDGLELGFSAALPVVPPACPERNSRWPVGRLPPHRQEGHARRRSHARHRAQTLEQLAIERYAVRRLSSGCLATYWV